MDIMTIIGGMAAPAGGDGVTGAAVEGDLAALFAAVLQAAAGGVTVPVDPAPAGADGPPAEAPGDGSQVPTAGTTPADIGAMLGLGGLSQPAVEGADTPVAVPIPTRDAGTAAGTVEELSPVATAPGVDRSAPGPGAAVPAEPATAPLRANGEVAPTAVGRSVPEPSATPIADEPGDATADADAPAASAEPTKGGPATARPAPQAAPPVIAGSGEASVTTTDVAASRGQAAHAATPSFDPSVVDRVMEAIDSLENAPPPRRIRVEVGDLRVAVSLRHDGVHVTVDGDALPTPSWDADLTTALEARGLTLAGSGTQEDEGRHERPTPQPEDTADTPPAPRPARAEQGDDALRL